jgi:hypothetical protein
MSFGSVVFHGKGQQYTRIQSEDTKSTKKRSYLGSRQPLKWWKNSVTLRKPEGSLQGSQQSPPNSSSSRLNPAHTPTPSHPLPSTSCLCLVVPSVWLLSYFLSAILVSSWTHVRLTLTELIVLATFSEECGLLNSWILSRFMQCL